MRNRLPGGAPDDLVTAPVEFDQLVGLLARVGCLGEHRRHLVPVGGCPASGGEPGGVGLHDRPRLVEHRQLVDVDRADEHAPARDHRDELVAGESLERFADRGAAHVERRLQVRLADHVARGEVEADDHPSDLVVRAFGEREMLWLSG